MLAKSSLEKIYLVNRDRWFRFAVGMLGDESDALDVLQDAYLKVQEVAQRKPVEKPEAYFFLVIRNGCYDRLKQKSRLLELSEKDFDLQLIISDYELKDEVAMLRRLLERLPTAQRSVILLKDIEGYTYDEVSTMLEMDKNNIRVNLSLARKKIRKAFADLREYELKKHHNGE